MLKLEAMVVSVTEAINDFYGVSQASADLRNSNGGMVDVVDTDGKPSAINSARLFI